MTAGVWIIATVAIGLVLHQGARILGPFAMAIFVWLVMEGFCPRHPQALSPTCPSWLTYLLRGDHRGAVSIVDLRQRHPRARSTNSSTKSSEYERHINDIIKNVYTQLEPARAPAGSSRRRPLRPGQPGAGAHVETSRPPAQPPTVAAAPVQQRHQPCAVAGNPSPAWSATWCSS